MITEIKELIKLIEQTKLDYKPTIDSMPHHEGITVKQQELRAMHGTPREFSEALVNAIGTISCSEAEFAMRDYLRRWNKAGE
jgi:hypothetical protein